MKTSNYRLKINTYTDLQYETFETRKKFLNLVKTVPFVIRIDWLN